MAKKMPKKSVKFFLKKFIPVLVFAAILSAAIFIASQLAARQAVTPNAPESEPEASTCAANVVGKCGPTGGCVMGKKCSKTGTATVRSEYGNRIVNTYGCVTDKSCLSSTTQKTKTCYKYDCLNGQCKPKIVAVPLTTDCSKIGSCKTNAECTKNNCDPAVTLERCKGSQPQVCQNYNWVNNGKSCVNGCAGAGICLSCKQGDTRCSGDGLSVEKCNNGVYVEVKGCKPNKCEIKNGLVQCSTSDRINACIPDDSYIVCNTLGCNNCPPNIKGYKCTCTAGGFYSCSCGI